MGIEPMAYALPRRCSAAELRGPGAPRCRARELEWAGMDSNHRRFSVADLQSAALGQLGDLPMLYSVANRGLASLKTAGDCVSAAGISRFIRRRADGPIRTDDMLFTKQLLCP